jgi:autotransporter-associated beta strand protein
MMNRILLKVILCCFLLTFPLATFAQRSMEKLDRSVVAHKVAQGVYVNWRITADEFKGTSYRLYRNGTLIHETGTEGASNFIDPAGTSGSVYTVTSVKNGIESAHSQPGRMLTTGFLEIPLRNLKALGKSGYFPNDATAADLDGDGAMEVIVKRVNAGWGLENTQYSFFEAYKLDGTFLWAIDVGPNVNNDVEINIAAFDLDGDGKAEVFMRTAEGTIFGNGTKIGDTNNDGITNYRGTASPQGYMNDGPEFLSLIDGVTGAELDRVDFIPRGRSSDWGDDYGHRSNKFFFGAPYLDGLKPSIFIGRGIYTKTEMRTYDVVNKKLVLRWEFKSGTSGPYFGQGNHNFTISDVDGDGKDEITWGSMCVDDNGKGLYSTQMGHGDAIHVSDFDPYRKGIEVFSCLENSPVYGTLFRDGATGQILHHYVLGRDCGRACAGNITDTYKGAEIWGAGYGYSATNLVSQQHFGVSENFTIYWDGDLTKELLDHSGFSTGTGVGYGQITKFNSYGNISTLLNANAYSNNYTKGTPNLQADIMGDWREEAIWWRSDSMALRIYTTTHPTQHRIYTLLHDHQYRQAICWQMCGYNQPPHTSFYLGSDFPEPIAPKTTNGMMVWKGSTSDFTAANWMDGNDAAALHAGTSPTVPFSPGQRVLFDPRAVVRTVMLSSVVEPEVLTVSGLVDYTFSGSGSLAGTMWLDKMGEGKLTLSGIHTYTGVTDVWEGTLLITDTLTNSLVKIRRHAVLELTGKAGAGISTEYNAQLYTGGKNSVAMARIKGGFQLAEGARWVMDLSSATTGNNDRLLVDGTLTLAAGSIIQINQTEGKLGAGSYVLAQVNTLIGDISKVKIEGTTGTATELSYNESTRTLYLVVKGVRSASSVVWTGSTSAVWDLANSANWSKDGVGDIFVGNDTVMFDSSSSRRSVTISETLNPAHMVVNSTLPYAFDGTGKLTGEMTLQKMGAGSLAINNRNDFTGKVLVQGGLLTLKYAPTATNMGGIGPNDADPSKLVLSDSAVIQINTANEMTGRGISFSGPRGGVISVPLTLYWDGPMTGTKMTKTGSAVLNIGNNNNNLQETVLRSGTLRLNATAAVPYGPGRKLTMMGGTLETVNITGAYLRSDHSIDVPQSAAATFVAAPRCEYNGSLTGSGTITWVTDFIRSYINGNWSQFAGRINITRNTANSTYEDKFIVNTALGFPNATVHLGSSDLIMCYKNGTADNGTTTIKMGMLSGVAGSVVYNAGVEVGALNTNGSFAGTFTGATTLRKVGTGLWLLSGDNTNTGSTTVAEGSVTVSGKLGSGAISVQNGALLTLNGSAGGSAIVANGGTLVLGGTLSGSLNNSGLLRGTGTINGSSIMSSGAELQPGSSIVGTLTFGSSLTLRSGASLSMQVLGGGNSADQLKVGGVLTLAGTLDVSSYAGIFAEGAEYQLLTAGSISGEFEQINLPALPASLAWDTTELYTRGVLKVITGVSGVLNPRFESKLLNNPSTDRFIINTMTAFVEMQVQVTDLNGRNIMQTTLTADAEGRIVVDLEHYSSGIYLLTVIHPVGERNIHRLIKL